MSNRASAEQFNLFIASGVEISAWRAFTVYRGEK
jgi:hypothetical protein